MNKLKQLRRRLIRDIGYAVGVLIAFVGLSMLTGSFAESAKQKKTVATGQLSQDQTQLANLKNQFNKSGEAEKRFVDIALAHTSKEYAASSDAMKNMLRKAKEQFRFAANFKLTLANEKTSDKPEFAGLNYDVTIRDPMRIELEAMSDTHVYSFINSLMHDAPGFIRVSKLEIKRNGEMDAAALGKMSGGEAPSLVNAAIEFMWVGVTPKKPDASGGAAKTP